MITILRTKSEWKKVSKSIDVPICALCCSFVGLADIEDGIVQVETGNDYFFMHKRCAMKFSGEVLKKSRKLTGECGRA